MYEDFDLQCYTSLLIGCFKFTLERCTVTPKNHPNQKVIGVLWYTYNNVKDNIILLKNIFCSISVNYFVPCNYLSRECGLNKANDLLLGDHVCEKSDAVNWIDCP